MLLGCLECHIRSYLKGKSDQPKKNIEGDNVRSLEGFDLLKKKNIEGASIRRFDQ